MTTLTIPISILFGPVLIGTGISNTFENLTRFLGDRLTGGVEGSESAGSAAGWLKGKPRSSKLDKG